MNPLRLLSSTPADALEAARRAELRLKTERAIRLSQAGAEALTPLLREAREEQDRLMGLWEQAEARGDEEQARGLARDYRQQQAVADAIERCQRVALKAGREARAREMASVEAEFLGEGNRTERGQ